MRRLVPGLLLAAVLFGMPALAQKVTIDYAKQYDFDKVKTFTFIQAQDSGTGNQLGDDRIRAAIVSRLQAGGLREVPSGGDLYVTYHVATQEQTVFNTTTMGYGGWGAGWGAWGGGYGSSTTTTSTYIDGTLIVDAYEPNEKKLVWRGTGTATVKGNPEKRSKQIDNIVAKMGERWQKILAEQGQ